MSNWQSDSQQQGGGWYSGSSDGWAGSHASGYEIPMDDDEEQFAATGKKQQAASNPFFDVSKQTTHSASAFGSSKPQNFGQSSAHPAYSTPFFPNRFNDSFADQNNWSGANNNSATLDEDDRPLLEELGINFDHIRQKTLAVLNPLMTADRSVLNDNDLSGPLVFCLIFGFSLLLHGKVHFGYVYGIGLLGCSAMYTLLNLMSAGGISLACAVSVLGYCLLPMSLLSLVAAVFSFKGVVGLSVAIAAVFWCSFSSSKLFVTALAMDRQRILVAYPCALFYGLFALMAIF